MEPIKLQKIDESLLPEHSCIQPNDYCYFLGEYASRLGFEHSDMNQVINNLKKPVERKTRPEWYYKEREILKIAFWLTSSSSWQKLRSYMWIPMPSSKVKEHPKYDDRLWRILLKMKEIEDSLDIRELLLGKTSREAAHNPGAKRPSITEHLDNFYVDDAQKNPTPKAIAIFDDLITSGSSFKAAQMKLQEAFPGVPIIGIFVARSVRIADELL